MPALMYESTIRTVLVQFRLSEEKQQSAVDAAARAIQQLRSAGQAISIELVRNQTVIAILPEIRNKAIQYFRLKHVAHSHLEDLASVVIAKVWLAAEHNKITGNAGAFVARIHFHEFVNYCRRQQRERKHRPLLKPESVVDQFEAEEQAERFWKFVRELPKDKQDIVIRFMAGDSLQEIAVDCGIRRNELIKLLQSLNWPGGLL